MNKSAIYQHLIVNIQIVIDCLFALSRSTYYEYVGKLRTLRTLKWLSLIDSNHLVVKHSILFITENETFNLASL